MTGFVPAEDLMGGFAGEIAPVSPLDGLEEDLIVEIPDEDGLYLEDLLPLEDEGPAFNANLAEFIDEDELGKISTDLMEAFEDDRTSREDWDKTLKKGLEILGLKLEDISDPFEGACSAHHPVLLEAVLQFQARAITELFPVEGPVKTKVIGAYSADKITQAARVKEFLNFQLTEVMEEYFDDLDQMLFMLPLSGSMFKKTYYDDTLGRPCSPFIAVDDFVVPYNTTDLRNCGRMTHVISLSKNDLKKRVTVGFYRDAEVQDPADQPVTGIKESIDKIEGRSPGGTRDANHTLLEMHVDYDMPGFEDVDGVALPYIITIDKDSGKVLSIYRNWSEGDKFTARRQWFTHYKFLPGPGFYGLSLVHVLGNLQKTATAILRSLVDAGQFANLPGGFKARGMRVAGGDQPVKFGEYRDVEGYGDDIRKAIVPMPTKEPSQTLALLLGSVVEDARRLGAVADLSVGDADNEAPVGTTLALMEQGIKMMSAIHKRLHRAQRAEFKLLARVNNDFLPDEYPYEVEGGDRTVFRTDFDGRVDVLPVSDPNIFSETQRIMRAQTQLQLATQFPQQHNLHEALRRMHEVIGTPKIETVLNSDRGPKLMDPATENFAVTQARAVKAYVFQDHNAHIQVHQTALQAFMAQAQQNPAMAQAAQVMMAHIAEHQAHLARMQIEQMSGVQLPAPPDYDPTNPNAEDGYEIDPQMEVQIARLQGQAAQQIAAMQQQAAAAQQQQAMQQDPQIQIAMQQLQIEAQKVQQKAQDAEQKNQLRAQEIQNFKDDQERDRKLKASQGWVDAEIERQRIETQAQVERERMDTQARTDRERMAKQAEIAAANRRNQAGPQSE